MHRWIVLSLSLSLVSVVGCGSEGADGADAATSLIDSERVMPGDECSAGGLRVFVGIDDDGDGALAEEERRQTQVLCNGTVGPDGNDGDRGSPGEAGEDGDDGAPGDPRRSRSLDRARDRGGPDLRSGAGNAA